MAASGLHISISAEPVFNIGGLVISNSILTSLIVSALLILFALLVKAQVKSTSRPIGLQNSAEWIVEALLSLVDGVTGSQKKTRQFFPLIATFFLFILLNNWLGLLPGVGTFGYKHGGDQVKHFQLAAGPTVSSAQVQAATTPVTQDAADNRIETGTDTYAVAEDAHAAPAEHEVFSPYFRAGTADLNTTLALATISVFITQVFGFQYLKFSYFSKFINLSSPLAFFIGLLETVLELAKVVSFAFRLFGNIFAGEVLLAVIAFLVPVVVPMPFYGIELFVGVIQALVFSMLSVVFFNMATISHDEH